MRHQIIPASYLVLIKDNKVLLLRRFNTGYADGNYSLVAGHVEQGETCLQTIIREAKEEAGITITPNQESLKHVMHRKSNGEERVDFYFVVDQWEGNITNNEPSKCDDLSWFDLNNLPQTILPYITHALECIQHKVYYSEWGWNV